MSGFEKLLWLVFWINTGLIVSTILIVAPFAWTFRDGLGPGFVATKGSEAFQKWFMFGHWGPLFLYLVALQIGVVIGWKRIR